MRLKSKISIIIYLLVVLLVSSIQTNAKLFSKKDKQEEVDISKLSIEENLLLPKIGRHTQIIVDFQDKQSKILEGLANKGLPYTIQKIRNGEVLAISVPVHSLFEPNETVLSEKGKKVLRPLLRYLDTPKLYKMVLVMHSDNTGNDIYTKRLTTFRVNSVYDWIGESDKSKTDNIVSYSLGNKEPIVDNNSVINRAKNRRLVVYLIPDKEMLSQAKRGKITL